MYIMKGFAQIVWSIISRWIIICRKLPRSICPYCKLEFHILKKNAKDPKPICQKCKDNKKLYGEPVHCKYCGNRCAFNGDICDICKRHKEKYGEPKICSNCKHNCAFIKPENPSTIDNKLYCHKCYKNFKHESKKRSLDFEDSEPRKKQKTEDTKV